MKVAALSRSPAFTRHLRQALPTAPVVADRYPGCAQELILLLHLPSLTGDERKQLAVRARQCRLVACSDRPEVGEMLELMALGVRAYANSFMTAEHYAQMLQVVGQGQLWLPPALQREAFDLARRSLRGDSGGLSLEGLTGREAEIARAVAEGLSNREIADRCGISERTVKAHLSSIFRKLGIRDRKALLAGLRAA